MHRVANTCWQIFFTVKIIYAMLLLVYALVVVLCIKYVVGAPVQTICRNNRHITGKWEFNPNATKTFECCSWEKETSFWSNNRAKCGPSPLGGGTPIIYGGQPDKLSQVGGHSCDCDRHSRTTVKDREKYDWIPSYCELLKWNATAFCELLGERKMLLIGDSTMQQSASTLMNLIAESGQTCAGRILAARSNSLVHDGQQDFYHFIGSEKPDICILGTGAHTHSIHAIESIWERIGEHWNSAVASSPHTKFYWKTLSPGRIPQLYTEAPLQYWTPMPEELDQYTYNLYPQYDNISIQKALQMGMGIIDVSPLYLRADAHGDGAHLCMPGPINLFAHIVLTMLTTGEM